MWTGSVPTLMMVGGPEAGGGSVPGGSGGGGGDTQYVKFEVGTAFVPIRYATWLPCAQCGFLTTITSCIS